MSSSEAHASKPNWFFQREGEAVGPLAAAAMRKLVAKQLIMRDTLVRRGESGDWVAAWNVKGLIPEEPATSIAAVESLAVPAVKGEPLQARWYTKLCIAVPLGLALLAMLLTLSGAFDSGPRPPYAEIVEESLERRDATRIAEIIDSLLLSDFLTPEETAAMDAAEEQPDRLDRVNKYVGKSGSIQFETTHWLDSPGLSAYASLKRRPHPRDREGSAEAANPDGNATAYKSLHFATLAEPFSHRAIGSIEFHLTCEGKPATAVIRFSTPTDSDLPGTAAVASIDLSRSIPNPNYSPEKEDKKVRVVQHFTSYGAQIGGRTDEDQAQKPRRPQFISESLLNVSARK
jgi:hypothetical protein